MNETPIIRNILDAATINGHSIASIAYVMRSQ